MTYDDWKTESPEDEEARLGGPARKRLALAIGEEEHADYLLEEKRDRRIANSHEED